MRTRSVPKQSILVVDDEQGTRHLLKILLENLGYLVHEANCGLDAVKKAKEANPDMMIFDLKQENCQGFAILKPTEERRSIMPLALLNGQTHWSVFTKLLPNQTTRYIPKPISSLELGSVFQEFLPQA
ncbi:MAG: response regulator [Chloroflexota bacterium]